MLFNLVVSPLTLSILWTTFVLQNFKPESMYEAETQTRQTTT
jgi:hypothetical protein